MGFFLRVNIHVKIQCCTYFDITATGAKYNFNTGRLPFVADNGTVINDQQQWEFARNQQRNWETVIQLVSLRSLPYDITTPVLLEKQKVKQWQFEFTVDNPSSLAQDLDDLGALLQDCKGVPMLVGLSETAKLSSVLEPGVNIEFSILEW